MPIFSNIHPSVPPSEARQSRVYLRSSGLPRHFVPRNDGRGGAGAIKAKRNLWALILGAAFVCALMGYAPSASASQLQSQKKFGPWSVVSERDLGEDNEPTYLISMAQNNDLDENDLGNTIHMEWSSGSKTIRLYFSVLHCDGERSLYNGREDVELREWLAPNAKASGAMFRQRLAGMFKVAKAQFDANQQYHDKQCSMRDIESRFKMQKFDKAWAAFLGKVRKYSAEKGGVT
jgi:hypothetical protein